MSRIPFVDRLRGRGVAETGGSEGTPGRSTDEPAHGVGPLGVVPAGLLEPAAGGVLVTTVAYVSVFASVTDIVGGTSLLLSFVLLAGVSGAVLSRTIRERTAWRLTFGLLVVALLVYYFTIPESQRALVTVWNVAFDVVSLLTGLSVLRLAVADVWAIALAPVPTFLVAYLVGRGRHVFAATVAGSMLGFFVLTGDAGGTVTLVGVVGVAAAVGFEMLSIPGGIRNHGGALAGVVAVMILASATVTVIPVGGTQPWGVGEGAPGLESTLTDSEEITITGATRLSPEVRFTIQSPVERNWHTGSFDTYTGDGWVRSGETSPLEEPLSGPSGDTTTVEGGFTAETEIESLPAPWQAVDVSGATAGSARVDDHGTIRPSTPVLPDDEVTFESHVVDADPAALRNASTEYDPAIEDRYTQLPESTPDRVGERTEEILDAADADNPYDQAVAIERYLIEEYDYSLTVERPDGDIADGFLFEMDAGYCTYFATTMVAMLRTQGVPAQFATGYSSGEQVSEDEYVVRGQDAHAWVKAYFPEHGWVEFDPTPSAERDQARETRLAEARSNDVAGVDTEQSDPGENDVTTELDDGAETAEDETGEDIEDDAGADGETEGDAGGTEDASEELDSDVPVERDLEEGTPIQGETIDGGATGEDPFLPSPERLGYWLFVVVVAGAGARHVGLTDRAYHTARLRLPSRARTPREDTERAFEDLERLLARSYRGRRPGETPRAYLDALRVRGADERIHTVGEAYERAIYAEDVTREEAAAARRTVRQLALESTPVIGGLFGRNRSAETDPEREHGASPPDTI